MLISHGYTRYVELCRLLKIRLEKISFNVVWSDQFLRSYFFSQNYATDIQERSESTDGQNDVIKIKSQR